jgi:glutathione S-transferase
MARKKTKPNAKTRARKPKKLVASAKIKAAARKSAARAAKGATIRKKAAAQKGPPRKAARPAEEPFTLYGAYLSMPSAKVGLMLSMCGAKWAYKHVNMREGQNKTPEYLAMNRFGQVPVLQHGPRFLAQSNAILQYLAEHFGRFLGRSEGDRWRIAEWLSWDFDRFSTGVGLSRTFAKFQPQTHDEVKNYMRARGEQALVTLDRHLGTSKFLVGGTPTIADIAVFPWIATADEGGFTVANYPNVHAWGERMLTFPGVAHPYTIMPKEDRPAE